MSRITLERPAPGHLTIDVPGEWANKARIYTHDQQKAFALALAHAATLDVWAVLNCRGKRGVSNRGFRVLLWLER